ncbi:trans-aconitate 2-methyltransferase [Inquilinus sp. YAF38]|uniref:class I SAM-dependent methyltransferase n=1 Tax=Inquilinus sp. YAF38 TaxID=3233084 RepID=UPI003F8DB238
MHRPGRIATSPSARRAVASAFADADVARCYAARPPYAPELYAFLLGQVAGRGRALDLGCGPGKVAIVLADHFAEVVALDPSAAMIDAGRAADAGRHGGIAWTCDTAEAYRTDRGFDLVTAGTSIHWLDHQAVFPKLAGWTGTLAVIGGDEPAVAPCGDEAWTAFLARWLARVGGRYDPAGAAAEAGRHEAWMDIAGRKEFSFTVRQGLAEFIRGQHSRATWSRAVMGEALATEFDRELEALLRPFATDGQLDLTMVSTLSWGAPRREPRQ